jgi:hypothetical protein
MLQGCFIDGKNDLISEKEVVEALGIWATNGVKVNTKLLMLVQRLPGACPVLARRLPDACPAPDACLCQFGKWIL